ncbi:hypothetical protein B566_EDAN003072 [Ephemera danica]|nr:hypothetical protein B566_EDAN003072 [Ephemera danica]
MGSEHYCLRWNNHQSNLLGVFSQLLQDESLVDVTLACEGHSLRAHKVVLSACSSFFQSLFIDHPDRHPIVILKDVKFSELKTLLEFMYKGEVNVEYSQLSALLHTAESLRVKGLVEMTTSVEKRSGSPLPLSLETPKRAADSSPQPLELATKPTAPAPTQAPPIPSTRCRHESGPSILPVPGEPPGGLTSPRADPLPGPSGLLPVQQVPLSLKKEVDWGDRSNTGDDKSTTGESSSEYRGGHDPDMEEGGDKGSPNKMYSCMYCAAMFPHQSKLTRHILSHSLDSLKYREQTHPCFLLPPSTTAASLEPLNLDNHFRPPLKTDQLPPEEFSFKLEYSPSSSSSAVDAVEGSAVVCKFCGQAFPDVSALVAHLPAHTGDRPFKCSFCGKAFKLRHHMKDHCRVHTGERPFRCGLCGKTFSRSTILKAHEKTHYPKYMRKFLSPSPVDTEPPATTQQQPPPPHPPPPASLGSLTRTPPP